MGAGRKLGGAALVAAVLVAGVAGGTPEPASGQGGDDERPNVVVIMSDDQTQDSMRYMSRVQSLIGERGATFPTSVTNWPLCCPSRATFLTGQYAHNHQVLGNGAPLGGFDRLDTSKTLAVWLQGGGYYTAHIGKFLNGYEDSSVGTPTGWTEWHASKQTYTFYGYELLEDGQLVEYGTNAEDPDEPARPETYSTDVYTDKAVELIGRRAPSISRSSSRSPTWRRTAAARIRIRRTRAAATAQPSLRRDTSARSRASRSRNLRASTRRTSRTSRAGSPAANR
jgi:N-acetylglucosamine-6-sulfatase